MPTAIVGLINFALRVYGFGLLAIIAGINIYTIYEAAKTRINGRASGMPLEKKNRKEEIEVTEDFITHLTPKDIQELLLNTFVSKSMRRKIKAVAPKIKRSENEKR